MVTQEQLDKANAYAAKIASVGGSLLSNASYLKKTLAEMTLDVPVIPVGPSVIEFSDFASSSAGISQPSGALLGDGVDATTYRMKPKSSTHAGDVPAQGSGKTNQLYLIRMGTNDGDGPADINVGDFTLTGTDQGHLYGGLMVGHSQGARIHDLRISGIPGDAAGPPGETFSLNTWHANGAKVDNLTIDGRDAATGKGVAATLFGINSCNDLTITGYVGNYAISGMSMAIWDSYDVTVDGADMRNCRHPINIEQCHAGTMLFTNPDMRGQTDTGPAITCNTNIASTKLIIREPLWDEATYGPLRIAVNVGATRAGKPQVQKVEDVTVIIGGKDVSTDKSRVLIGKYW